MTRKDRPFVFDSIVFLVKIIYKLIKRKCQNFMVSIFFVNRMNKKAADLGLVNSTFRSPSGLGKTGHISTARDMLKLFVVASKNNVLNKIWAVKSKDIGIGGDNSRVESVESTYHSDTLLNVGYPVLGGKTGTLYSKEGLIACNAAILTEINGNKVVGVVMGAKSIAFCGVMKNDVRFAAMKELFDISKNVLKYPAYDISSAFVKHAVSAIACVLNGDGSYDILYEQEADKAHLPASMTKVLMILTALDYVQNLQDTIQLKTSDLVGGSGAVFKKGDIVSIKDLLYAIVLPSSNSGATALARHTSLLISKKSIRKNQ